LERIAQALNQVEGGVLVVGHTDNVPIRSLRFPSNWHLSRARAQAVTKILSHHLELPERIQSEGRGSAEPLVPNDSPQNRARNRRVEITLLKP
jgi:type VI secretion system protein ImpK